MMFVIATAQEGALRMIIKGYATLGFVARLAKIFADNFPPNVKKNLENMMADKDEWLKMEDDHNESWSMIKRYFESVKVLCGCKKEKIKHFHDLSNIKNPTKEELVAAFKRFKEK